MKAWALVSNYPFATIEPNVGVVGIPDPRLAVPAGIGHRPRLGRPLRFVDIVGLVRGVSEVQGLGNQFLAHIRETDAICQVVRVFADPDVSQVAATWPRPRYRDDRHRADPPGRSQSGARWGSLPARDRYAAIDARENSRPGPGGFR